MRLCGLLHEAEAVTSIGGVDLCAHHVALVEGIAGYAVALEVGRRHTIRQGTRETVLCRCGTEFTYLRSQGGARKWCDDCQRIRYDERRKMLKATA